MGGPAARVLLLGPVAVEVAGVTSPLSSPQQALFLALLALRPGHHLTTDDLLERAWPGQPPPARTAVRVQMARLSSTLRTDETDPLPHSAHGYALDPRAVQTDVRDLDRLVRRLATVDAPDERLQLAEEGLALWRGEPAVSAFDDEDLQIESRRLGEVRLDLEDTRTDALLDLGRHTRAAGDLVALVAAQPLRERRTRQLMLALYRAGRTAEALGACRELRDRLADELGVDRTAETAALELSILRQDPRLASEEPGQAREASGRTRLHLGAPPAPETLPAPTPRWPSWWTSGWPCSRSTPAGGC